MDLTGKIGLVTGAGRGIGAATALALARAGASVAVAARRQEDAEGVASAIRSAGGRALPLACDVTDPAAVKRMVAAVAGEWRDIDILVNNAGAIQPIALLADAREDEWRKTIEINLVGAFYCLRAVLPSMVACGSGTVIHLSSGAAHKALEGWSAYCASKAGLAMLTRSLHEEYAPHGIRSIGFSPGVVDTGMQAQVRESGINAVSKLPREVLTSADEPASAIVFLCGPGGARYAGQEVDIRDPGFRSESGLS